MINSTSIAAHVILKTHHGVLSATSLTEVFLMTQWTRNRIVISVKTIMISNPVTTFSPICKKNIDLIMSIAVLSSLALKNPQVKFTQV